jgi:tRNA G10  N-methylase Trm11
MKYVFIFGKNFELSLAELSCFFNRKGIERKFIDIIQDMKIAVFDIKTKFEPEKVINVLGGTIKIARVIIEEPSIKEMEENLKTAFLWEGKKNKINYAFTSDEETDNLIEDIQNNLKREKVKAFKIFSGKENPSKAKNIDLELFSFYSEYLKKYVIARVEAVYDTVLAEKIDMQKPARRSELAISPRLAKILINLSEVKENEVLMDPFCGIGAILIESFMQKQKFIGFDIDKYATLGAKKNLEWMKKEFKINVSKDFYRIKEQNAIFMEEYADAVASEPSLGPLKKKNFSPKAAAETKKKLENFYHAIFLKLRKYIKGRIAITMPRIVLSKGKAIQLNIEELCEKTAMKIHNPLAENGFDGFEMPLIESRENQHVAREIWILEKGEKIE